MISTALRTTLAFCLAGSALAAPRPSPRDADAVLLREYVNRMTAFGFSWAVIVRRGGETLVRDGFGEADRASSRPVTIDTPFYVASLAKPLTAAAVLRLADEGRLSPAESIARFVPGLPADRRGITIGHLLTHSAGLAEVRRRGGDPALDRDGFIAAAFRLPARFAPGERNEYSNTGYALLAAIVERASGRPFGDYLADAVLRPLGMRATFLVTRVPADAGLATAYFRDAPQGDAALSHQAPHSWETFGATGVVSTAADLERFDRMYASDAVLAPATRALMETPQHGNWAYGWTVQRPRRGSRVLRHDGLLMPEGWNAEVRRYLDENATVIVLSNVHEAEPLAWKVASGLDALLFGGAVTMPPAVERSDADAEARWLGDYVSDAGARWRVEAAGRALGVRALNQRAVNALIHAGQPADLFEAENARRQSIVTALFAGAPAGPIPGVKDLPRWTARFGSLRAWLSERFGLFESAEVLHTTSDPGSPDFTETFLAIRLGARSTTVRTIWSGDELVGLSDEGAFRGRAQEVPLYPGVMPLARQHGNRFFAWPFTGAPVGVTCAADAQGATITVGREIARRVSRAPRRP